MNDMNDEKEKPMTDLVEAVAHDPAIHELLARRWSPRAFDRARPVEREKIAALIEAARWAPSCFNDQPWRFVIADRAQDRAAWQAVADCLTGANPKWAINAPLLIAVVAAPRFGHNDKPNRWAQYDSGAAALSMALQAEALGLAAHQMGGFEREALATALAIPADHTAMAVMAVGYRAQPAVLPEDLAARETAPRTRKAPQENFFAGRWGRPAV